MSVVVGLCIFLMQDLAYHIVLLMSNLFVSLVGVD